MTLVFSKEKMLERLEKEGNMNYVDRDILDIMNILDKQPVQDYWKRNILKKPCYICKGRNREKFEVYEGDCIEV